MKKKILLIAIIVSSLISIQARTFPVMEVDNEELCSTCSGEFNIDGVSYTITLHDVSWWTCVKFKVASWFN